MATTYKTFNRNTIRGAFRRVAESVGFRFRGAETQPYNFISWFDYPAGVKTPTGRYKAIRRLLKALDENGVLAQSTGHEGEWIIGNNLAWLSLDDREVVGADFVLEVPRTARTALFRRYGREAE